MTHRALTVQDIDAAAEEFEQDFEPDLVHRFFEPVAGDSLENALPFEFSFEPPEQPQVGRPSDKPPSSLP
jgi:hypothetical protein